MKKFFLSTVFALAGMSMQAQNIEAVMNNAPKFPKATAFVHKNESKEYQEWLEACEEYNELELLDSGHANAAANAAKAKMAKEAKARQKNLAAMKGMNADQMMESIGGISMKDIEAMSNMTDEERMDYAMLNGLDKSASNALKSQAKNARKSANIINADKKMVNVSLEMFKLNNKWNARKDSLLTICLKKYNSKYAPQMASIKGQQNEMLKTAKGDVLVEMRIAESPAYKALDQKIQECEEKGQTECFYQPMIDEKGWEQDELRVILEKANVADRAAAKGDAGHQLTAELRTNAMSIANQFREVTTEMPDFFDCFEPVDPDSDKCTVKITTRFQDNNIELPEIPGL